MKYDPLAKKPAFFPSISAEIFFDAEDSVKDENLSLDVSSEDLDKELDAILKMSEAA